MGRGVFAATPERVCECGHPLVVEAVRDLERYRAAESFAFDSGLAPEGAAAAPAPGRVPVESDSGASGRSGAPATGPVME